jgi:hypothetical protein
MSATVTYAAIPDSDWVDHHILSSGIGDARSVLQRSATGLFAKYDLAPVDHRSAVEMYVESAQLRYRGTECPKQLELDVLRWLDLEGVALRCELGKRQC